MEPVAESYRCDACGGKTRFDVTVARVEQYYHHQDLSLDHNVTVENPVVLTEEVRRVVCHYCGPSAKIQNWDADRGEWVDRTEWLKQQRQTQAPAI